MPATALEIACKIETVAEDEPEPDTVELNCPANVLVIVDKEDPVPDVEELIDWVIEIVEEEEPEPVTVELIVRVVPEGGSAPKTKAPAEVIEPITSSPDVVILVTMS